MRGGPRKGAGRKPGSNKLPTKTLINFKLANEVLAKLKSQVPRGRRTRFVEAAITAALSKGEARNSKKNL